MGINLKAVIAVVIIALFLSCSWFIAHGVSLTAFTPTDVFDIPASNSSIRFAFPGTYEQASLENGVWNFVNLHSNFSRGPGKVNFKVSATDSVVNITFYSTYNSSFAGERANGAILRYSIIGKGTQVFDTGLGADSGDWSAIVNGEWIGENNLLSVSPNGTLTVTGATGTVILMYYGFPGSFGNSENGFNQPFLDQHFVIITTAIVVAIIFLLAVTIRPRKKEQMI